MHDSQFASLRFDVFEIDLKNRELRRHGVPVSIQQQPLRMLTFLALHAGQVVERKELMENLWGQQTFVDYEAGLNYCVRQVRKALGEDARKPRLLHTLNRHGYRLQVSVEHSECNEAEPVSALRRITVTLGPDSCLMEEDLLVHLAEGVTRWLSVSGRSGVAAQPDAPAISARRSAAGPELWISHAPQDERYLAVLRVE